MDYFELKNIDSDDLNDLILKVEKSFDIRFDNGELSDILTFGEFVNHVTNKIQLENSSDCTSQQAFYKLRGAISSTLHNDSKIIIPKSSLEILFPRVNRQQEIKSVEKQLGFNLYILQPPNWIIGIFTIILLVSLTLLFLIWEIGILGVMFSVAGLWYSQKNGNDLNVKTVGQAAEKMTRESYIKSRRVKQTFNQKEIERILSDWFCDELVLDNTKLTSDTKFV